MLFALSSVATLQAIVQTRLQPTCAGSLVQLFALLSDDINQKSLAYFSHLAPIKITKKQSQKEGVGHGTMPP